MSKKSVLESMKVSEACSADWEQMSGNDKVRFCGHCSKSVNNISEMTPKEAIRLVRRSNGSLCIRYYVDPQTQKPLFVDNFVHIVRRAPRIATGVITASLSLATMAYSQTTSSPQTNVPVINQVNKEPSVPVINDDSSTISGDVVIKDPPVLGGKMVMRPEHKGLVARAVARDDIEEVRNLIARGEDVNGREDDKTTPLFIAVENGNLEMAELLLNFGAKANARDTERQTPLMKLDDDASPQMIELLLRYGAKIDARDESGNTPLIMAAESAKAEVIQALINAGAVINDKNLEGTTALMNAAYEDNLENVRALLLAGADANLKNDAEETAYDKTSEKEIQQLLIVYGAIPKEKPQDPDQDVQIDN